MATLTSTIKISGTVNGQSISITSTMSIEDIYDAGITQAFDSEQAFTALGVTADPRPATFVQDSPGFLFPINRSPSETSMVSITNEAGSADRYLVIPPQGFVVLAEYQQGGGLLTIGASATKTLQGTSRITSEVLPSMGFVVKMDTMIAYLNAS